MCSGISSVHGNTAGKVNLVDLAGSERLKKSLATGDRLLEAKAINKYDSFGSFTTVICCIICCIAVLNRNRSLSALGDVLEALDKRSQHVPYRNSKLTHVLQDSLSSNSRTLMICAVPPTSLTADETLFTLQVTPFCDAILNICLVLICSCDCLISLLNGRAILSLERLGR